MTQAAPMTRACWGVVGLAVLGGCQGCPVSGRPDPITERTGRATDATLDVRDEVVARVGGAAIYRAEVEQAVAMDIYRRRVDIHSLVKAELERQIEARLLEGEAKRRGVSVENFVEGEIVRRVSPVTGADVEAYLEERNLEGRASQSDDPDRRGRVRAYLEARVKIEAKLKLVRELMAQSQVKVLLKPPPRPRVEVDIDGAPVRGSSRALVTIVHFASYTDGRSAQTAKVLESLHGREAARVRWVHRHVVRSGDEVGLLAALVARKAHDAKKFWAVHDALFAAPQPLTRQTVQTAAVNAGLRDLDVDTLRHDPGALAALRGELEIARRSGVTVPPVVFVNGRWFQGSFGDDELRMLVREELASSAAP